MALTEIIKLVNESIKIGKKIDLEIKKEKNARKRKKLKKACDSGDLDAIRKLMFD